jgi:hypothetical protein
MGKLKAPPALVTVFPKKHSSVYDAGMYNQQQQQPTEDNFYNGLVGNGETMASPVVDPTQQAINSIPAVNSGANVQVGNTVQPQYAGKDIYTSSGLAAMSPEEQQSFGANGGTIGENGQLIPGTGGTTGLFDSIGGMKGFSDGASGLASLYGMYYDTQKNKRADQVLGMQKDAVNAQYAANANWNKNVAASGLGLASRPS